MEILKKIKEKDPLIHCITNNVTINDCANAVLAIGASPVMAEHPSEVEKITAAAAALLINTGTIYDSKIEAMYASVKSSGINGIPFILDCVGAASSEVRKNLIRELIKINTPSIIKGNAAEIEALMGKKMAMSGVDSKISVDKQAVMAAAKELGTVIAVTGREDLITDGRDSVLIGNGCEMMSKITGTGCMLGCIMAAAAAVTDPFSAARYSSALMGICGERAYNGCGTGTFRIRLMDGLSTINDDDILKNTKEQ